MSEKLMDIISSSAYNEQIPNGDLEDVQHSFRNNMTHQDRIQKHISGAKNNKQQQVMK